MSASDKQSITTLLQSYAAALSKSSTSEVMKLYTSDAVFMPQHFTTITGFDNVSKFTLVARNHSLTALFA
jgi:ketosteroid isomerase-like protein